MSQLLLDIYFVLLFLEGANSQTYADTTWEVKLREYNRVGVKRDVTEFKASTCIWIFIYSDISPSLYPDHIGT